MVVFEIEDVLYAVGSVEANEPFYNGSNYLGIFFFFFDMLVSASKSCSAPIRTSLEDYCFSLKLPVDAFIVLEEAEVFLFV